MHDSPIFRCTFRPYLTMMSDPLPKNFRKEKSSDFSNSPRVTRSMTRYITSDPPSDICLFSKAISSVDEPREQRIRAENVRISVKFAG